MEITKCPEQEMKHGFREILVYAGGAIIIWYAAGLPLILHKHNPSVINDVLSYVVWGSYVSSPFWFLVLATGLVRVIRHATQPTGTNHVTGRIIQIGILGLGTLITGLVALWFIIFIVMFPMKGLGG